MADDYDGRSNAWDGAKVGITTLVLIAIATAVTVGSAITQIIGWLHKRWREQEEFERRLRRLEREREKLPDRRYGDRSAD